MNIFQLQEMPQLFHFDSTGFWNPLTPTTSLGTRLVVSTICVVPAVLMGLKMDMWFRPLADGQKGDNQREVFLVMAEYQLLIIKSTGIFRRIQ